MNRICVQNFFSMVFEFVYKENCFFRIKCRRLPDSNLYLVQVDDVWFSLSTLLGPLHPLRESTTYVGVLISWFH
ncbi:hypothetical protein L2E82_21185 [Cichorium intybus]|uniref:Uncharacterized protein n=1 Tax=Cichorium intybus TaxID=13427 RepID=A0ACB9DV65_CICIN|nr:hypothetical protein L2E82_21185 [Cichorium intybus]